MRTPIYKKYANAKAIGVLPLSNWGGLEILDIEYGIEDYAIACFNFGNGRYNFRRHKIYTAPSGKMYIRKLGTRYYLDQILRA